MSVVLSDDNLLYEILKHLDARALGSAGCVNTNGTVRPKSRLMELEFALKNNWANNTQLRSVVLALGGFKRLHSQYLWPLSKPNNNNNNNGATSSSPVASVWSFVYSASSMLLAGFFPVSIISLDPYRRKSLQLPLQGMIKGISYSSVRDDGNDSSYRLLNNFDQSPNSVNSRASFVSQFMEAMPSQKDDSSENFKEMLLAGTVIHIVPEKKNVDIPLYKRWATPDAQCGYEAYVANQEAFKDMIVSHSCY
ncbi:hypothetical protein Tco_0884044 [Tanacetum coccineum]